MMLPIGRGERQSANTLIWGILKTDVTLVVAVPPYRFTKTIFSDHSAKLTALLRKARVDAGLTQVQAAERLGCRQTFLSKIECGERRLDVVEFSLICLAYGVPPGELLDRFITEAKLQSSQTCRSKVRRKDKA